MNIETGEFQKHFLYSMWSYSCWKQKKGKIILCLPKASEVNSNSSLDGCHCRYFLLFKLWICIISGIGSWTISSQGCPHFFLTYRHEWSSKNSLSKKDFGLSCYFFGIWPCVFRPFLTNWDADFAQIHPYPIKLVFALLDQFTLAWIPLLHQ